MGERVIKTGLSKKYKDMLDSVIGQMSDGYWENTPMMRGYWKFCDIGTAGDEVTIEVEETSGALDGDRHIDNRFYGMSDDAVKKFFADKIKFLIKEEGLGKWDRRNESETDFLSYGKPRYRVKDCYYAYEILKGRYARKHPEYGDVAEAKGRSPKRERGGTDDDSIESRLVYVGRLTGEYSDGLAWDLASITRQSRRIRLRVIELLDKFDEAIDAGDDDALVEIADDLKAFTGDESRKAEGARANEGSLERRLEDVAQATGGLTYNDAWRLDSASENDKELRQKVHGLLNEFDDAAYDGDDAAMERIAKQLKELADSVPPSGESRANEKRVMDTSEPYEISRIKEYMAKKGWTWNFNDKNNHFWFAKDGHPRIEGDLVPWSAYVLTNGNDIYFGRSLRNWKADMKAIGLNESKRKKNPSKDFSSTVEEDEDGKKKSH